MSGTDAPPPTEEYKVVTVVFCDVVGSTHLEHQLDSLPMQRLLDRYGQAVRKILGDRGASVGKRHGDGFMAAFGVPELHEDDALRAVRAAGELRSAVDELAQEARGKRGLEFSIRLGINTGNVLVGDAGSLEEELTGPPVNLAKRFEEAAGTGEILLGEETYRLVAEAVRAEPARPVTVEGAAEPQSVWRLREVLPDRPGRSRRPIAPMVGRGHADFDFAAYEKRVFAEVRTRLGERLAATHAAGRAVYELPEPAELAERMVAAVPLSHEWDTQVGPFYDTAGLSQWLGITRQGVHDRARRRALLSVMTSEGKMLYPAWQFDDAGRLLPGLREVLEVFQDVPVGDWSVAVWLTTPDETLNDRTPAQSLRDGLYTETVRQLATDVAARWRW